jgi:hypothetical protein
VGKEAPLHLFLAQWAIGHFQTNNIFIRSKFF